MKRVLVGLVLTGLLLAAIVAWGASQLPGPPEQFKDWPQVGEKWGACPDGRLLQIKAYAKDANFENPGALVYSDDQGPFVWIYFTDKDEAADTRWFVAFDGVTFWMFNTMEEIAARWSSPCDIPRPLREQPL